MHKDKIDITPIVRGLKIVVWLYKNDTESLRVEIEALWGIAIVILWSYWWYFLLYHLLEMVSIWSSYFFGILVWCNEWFLVFILVSASYFFGILVWCNEWFLVFILVSASELWILVLADIGDRLLYRLKTQNVVMLHNSWLMIKK